MKRNFFLALTIIALASLACGITLTMPDDAIEIGELRTDEIFVSPPSGGTAAEVKLEFGAGDLFIKSGAAGGFITGTATYNVDGVEPRITSAGSEISIEQDPYEFQLGGLPNVKDVENTWDLAFSSHPMTLEVRAGAYDGEFDFGGLAIQELKITTGASKNTINFSSPNLAPMSQFQLRTGASSAELLNLANANFSLLKFEGGAGNYTLDFSGGLNRDATIEIDAALSNMNIIVPENTPTTLQLEGSLTNVNARGLWAGGASTYSLAGEGPTLTFVVKLGAGNLDLSTIP